MTLFRAVFVMIVVSLSIPAAGASAIPPYGPGATAIVGVLANTDGSATITAGGFCPGSTIVITVGGVTVASGTAGVDGTNTFLVPAASLPSAPGIYPVVAYSTSNPNPACDRNDTAEYTVSAAVLAPGVPDQVPGTSSSVASQAGSNTGGATLPTTGSSNTVSMTRLAIISIAGGFGLLAVAAVRRRSLRVRNS